MKNAKIAVLSLILALASIALLSGTANAAPKHHQRWAVEDAIMNAGVGDIFDIADGDTKCIVVKAAGKNATTKSNITYTCIPNVGGPQTQTVHELFYKVEKVIATTDIGHEERLEPFKQAAKQERDAK